MTHDSPLRTFEVEVINEFATFIKKVRFGKEGEKKSIMNINLSMQRIEPWSPARKARVLTTTISGHWC